MVATESKTAESILVKFSGNLQVSLAEDLVKFGNDRINGFRFVFGFSGYRQLSANPGCAIQCLLIGIIKIIAIPSYNEKNY